VTINAEEAVSRARALRSDLEIITAAPRGVFGVCAADLSALPKLAQLRPSVNESDYAFRQALANHLGEALRLEPADWRASAHALYGLSVSQGDGYADTARIRLAAKAEGIALRSFKRNAKRKYAGSSPLALTHDATASKLLRLEDGEGAPPPRLPAPVDGWSIEDVQRALPGLSTADCREIVPELLRPELGRVLAEAYHAFVLAHEARAFIASTPALTLRRNIHDSNDLMYVLSRRDEVLGIRQDPRWPGYKEWIRQEVKNNNKMKDGINHIRVIVRSDPAPLEEGADELKRFHRPDSLFTITSEMTREHHRLLNDFPFGFALSTRHEYVLISIPPVPAGSDFRLDARAGLPPIREYLARCEASATKQLDGPMQAIVTADEEIVGQLRDAFEVLRDDRRHVDCLK
jgi:hypothetical protein